MGKFSKEQYDDYAKLIKGISFHRVSPAYTLGGFFQNGTEKPGTILVYLYKMLDQNYGCRDRGFPVDDYTRVVNGDLEGYILVIARDRETKQMVYDTDAEAKEASRGNLEIVNPADVWIAKHYNGLPEQIAKEEVDSYQGDFQKGYHNIMARCQGDIVLSRKEIPAFTGQSLKLNLKQFCEGAGVPTYAEDITYEEGNYSLELKELNDVANQALQEQVDQYQDLQGVEQLGTEQENAQEDNFVEDGFMANDSFVEKLKQGVPQVKENENQAPQEMGQGQEE